MRILLIACALIGSTGIHAAAERPLLPVIAVMPRNTLPAVEFTAMADEVQRIWFDEGIRIRWQAGVPASRTKSEWVVMIHVVPHIKSDQQREPLGTAIGAQGPISAAVFVSQHMARELLGTAGVAGSDGRFAIVYGRLVGRVVAHELGHLLLQTHEHRPTGLMRERFERVDVLTTSAPRFSILPRDRTLVASFREDVDRASGVLKIAQNLLADRRRKVRRH